MLHADTTLIHLQMGWLAMYLILPSILLLLLSLFEKNTVLSPDEEYLNLIPHLNEEERLNFWRPISPETGCSYIQNYLKINQNILILRDYSAGSNATTMLCVDREKIFLEICIWCRRRQALPTSRVDS